MLLHQAAAQIPILFATTVVVIRIDVQAIDLRIGGLQALAERCPDALKSNLDAGIGRPQATIFTNDHASSSIVIMGNTVPADITSSDSFIPKK